MQNICLFFVFLLLEAQPPGVCQGLTSLPYATIQRVRSLVGSGYLIMRCHRPLPTLLACYLNCVGLDTLFFQISKLLNTI